MIKIGKYILLHYVAIILCVYHLYMYSEPEVSWGLISVTISKEINSILK